MALRVLLADESSTIKKVFQLALQDFAVDVRPVNVGSDVAEVAGSFKPDIIFADVLLQKRSGYEVASELKSTGDLKAIPVVLMWSGFMELDEDKFQASHANARLEKPFDVTALRKLVTELVPKTQSQRLSQFLSFPKLPEFDEAAPPPAPEAAAPAPVAAEEEFQQVSIPRIRGTANADKHLLDLSAEELDPEHVPVDVEAIFGEVEADEDDAFTVRPPPRATEPSAPRVAETVARATEPAAAARAPEAFAPRAAKVAPLASAPPASAMVQPLTTPSLSEAQLEAIVREQSQQTIEALVWKIVPDLAAQIIERELNRLLKERESSPY